MEGELPAASQSLAKGTSNIFRVVLEGNIGRLMVRKKKTSFVTIWECCVMDAAKKANSIRRKFINSPASMRMLTQKFQLRGVRAAWRDSVPRSTFLSN